MRLKAAGLALALAPLATSCLSPIDLYGQGEEVTQHQKPLDQPLDDRIEDKHPEFDPQRTVVEELGTQGCAFELNKSATVTKLDLSPFDARDAGLKDQVFRTRTDAANATAAVPSVTLIPSMETVNGALKPFDDGLYAAVELGLEEGRAGVVGKRAFLEDLLRELLAERDAAGAAEKAHIERAAVQVAAALKVGGAPFAGLPSQLSSAVDALVAEFEAKPLFSKPIGFYTWSAELARIFRQDRLLQNNLVSERDPLSLEEFGQAAAMAMAVNSSESLRSRYEMLLALNAGLTNPHDDFAVTLLVPFLDGADPLANLADVRSRFLAAHPAPPLDPACSPHFALLPASRSKETRFFEQTTCSGGVLGNAMQALTTAIRNGRLDLAPATGSGWYDYQSYALETLLLPERASESQHLLLTAAYKAKLVDTFQSLLTQHRETHVKQLEIGAQRVSVVREQPIYPKFEVEPFPTFYLRSARAYRFLAGVLEATLGSAFLDGAHRLTEDGRSMPTTLREELDAKAKLLYGLHLKSADGLGLKPELLDEELAQYDERACRDAATAWLGGWRTDADVQRDVRVIVPVQQDKKGTSYWAVTGVKVLRIRAEFAAGHEPRNIRAVGELPCQAGAFEPREYYLLTEASSELSLPAEVPPPTRDEFRAACDEDPSLPALTRRLGGK